MNEILQMPKKVMKKNGTKKSVSAKKVPSDRIGRAFLLKRFKEEAKRHKFSPSYLPEQFVEQKIDELLSRIPCPEAEISYTFLHWDFCPSGEATVTFGGETHRHFIPADMMLVGYVEASHHRYTFFKKFVSHPFYQSGKQRCFRPG